MPSKGPLKGGKPRLLANHLSRDGKAYSKAYSDLEEAYGPFSLSHVRFEAGRVALLRVQLQHWCQELSTAQRKRKNARGRCPSTRDVERLARRQGPAFFDALVRLPALQQQALELEQEAKQRGKVGLPNVAHIQFTKESVAFRISSVCRDLQMSPDRWLPLE